MNFNKDHANISVYFRDLNNGPWLSVNSQNIFDGASLLKVPTMIAYLKNAENNKAILYKKIKYDKSFNNELDYDPIFDQTLKIGEEYSVEYLIKTMIQQSDNTAVSLLQLASIEPSINLQPSIEETNRIIGLDNDGKESNLITIDYYASLFRMLYNAEYLNGEMSNKALEIMTKTDYKNGLTRYLPADLTIAHKYGIRYYYGDSFYQIHDCGIIYASNPYILCVMTAGDNLEKQEFLISDIAKKSYDIFK